MAKFSVFKDQESLFACPICQAPMHLDLSSLVCQNRHTFNIAKQGFVNFLRQTKGDKHYDMASFEKRSQILAAGYYDPILEVISEHLRDLPKHSHVLDVACGEGYYSRQLAQEFDKDFMAFDLSKDSILLAARQNPQKNVAWFVGDLAQLPLREHSIDVIMAWFLRLFLMRIILKSFANCYRRRRLIRTRMFWNIFKSPVTFWSV